MQEALNILRGAVTIVYPMGLPPHDPIRCEFENTEDLSGTQVQLVRFYFRACDKKSERTDIKLAVAKA